MFLLLLLMLRWVLRVLLLLLLLLLVVWKVKVVRLVVAGSGKLLDRLNWGLWTLLLIFFLVSRGYDHATLTFIVQICRLRLYSCSSRLVLPVFCFNFLACGLLLLRLADRSWVVELFERGPW